MTKTGKTLYILSIIFLALAVLGGALAVVGFFAKFQILQIVGAVILVISYIASLIFDLIRNKRKDKL